MAVHSRFSLYKRRSSQTYYIGYYKGGKRYWKSTGVSTRPEALKALTQFTELLQERQKHVSISKFVQDLLAYSTVNHRPKTVELFRHTLENFLSLTGNISLGEVTAEHFDRYKTRRLRDKTEREKNPKERSPVSVNVELNMLRAAFGTAKRWGLIERNPFTECVLCPVPEQVPAFFSPGDFDRLLNSLNQRWLREVVVFAVLTGMRRGEILNLQWKHVDLVRRLVTIESSPTFKTKAGKTRVVPLNETATYLLEARRALAPSEYVFTKNDKPINESLLSHSFKKAVKRAKLPEGLHFHSLRHTFASWLAQDGVSLYAIQKLLGHSSASVTQIYSHLQPSELRAEVERISITRN